MARKLGDEALAVWALRMVTHGLVEEGRIAEGQTFATEAFETATRLGTPFETGTAFGALGIVRRAEGDYAAAAQHFDNQAAQHRASGERWFRAAVLADAAEAEERRGNLVRAETLLGHQPSLSFHAKVVHRSQATAFAGVIGGKTPPWQSGGDAARRRRGRRLRFICVG